MWVCWCVGVWVCECLIVCVRVALDCLVKACHKKSTQVCCSVLQCVAASCTVLQYLACFCRMVQHVLQRGQNYYICVKIHNGEDV